jgi:FkbM family methyltransferase
MSGNEAGNNIFSTLRTGLLRAYMRTSEHPTKYRMVRWLGRHVFPEQGILCRVYPDTALLLHPRDWIEYLLLRGERYEPETLDFLASNLRIGDVAVLAGVNFGLHVAVAARSVGNQGLVIGVEPQPAALLRAEQNLRLNGVHQRVKLVCAALGSSDGLVHMAWADPQNTGAASLTDEGLGLTVPLLRLSYILETLSPRKPRLLLLDVQGFESQVLAGLGGHCRPEILIVELDPEFLKRVNVTASQLLHSITDLGYALHTLDGVEATAGSKAFTERNVICVKPGSKIIWSQKASV